MSRRDYRRRETKKPKKDAKKSVNISLQPQATVEVVKKGKKTATPPEE